MPSKDWVKCEGEKGIYKRKKKDEPNKYDYLLVYHLGYTEEFDEKTGKNRRKENQKVRRKYLESRGNDRSAGLCAEK
jgi:hypothetical protein